MTDQKLTLEEQATNFATMRHIERVRNLLNAVIKELLDLAEKHDQSKLEQPEVCMFTTFTPKLKASTYGSEEYNGYLKEMGVALRHHYQHNRHHPEYHKEGIDGMTLIDLIEMLVDWKAASERHADGCILRSIELNRARFGLSDQLARILENTARELLL